MMLQYVREGNRKNRKIGVLVAVLNDKGKIVIGHSKWHKRLDKDNFNLERGRKVAIERAQKDSLVAPPFSFEDIYFRFSKRAMQYFKNSKPSRNTTKSGKLMLANGKAQRALDKAIASA